jgi:hypothetical protein
MTQIVSENSKRSIKIISNDIRAFEVQFVRQDGTLSEKCLVMGADADVHVQLFPGFYTLRIKHLSDTPTNPISDFVEVSDETNEIDLSNMFTQQFEDSKIRSTHALQTSELKKAIRPSLLRSIRSMQSAQSKTLRRESSSSTKSSRSNLGTSVLINNEEHSPTLSPDAIRTEKGLDYEVGLSQNTISRDVGWLDAEDIDVQLKTDTIGSLEFEIHDKNSFHTAEFHKLRRVRLTLAIEGRPAIRTPLPLFTNGIRVLISPFYVNNVPDAVIRIEAIDAKAQALVSALSGADKDEARAIVEWTSESISSASMELLLHKKRDLWSATVAALLLAKTYQLQPVAKWAYNLQELAPHISDASVAAAWARASDDEGNLEVAERQTLGYLKKSRKIGSPTLKITHTIALELLNAIRGSSEDPKLRDEARNEMSIWVRRAKNRLFKGPYIMWEQAGFKLHSGKLPKERYLRVASGSLSQKGFHSTLR